MNAGNMAEENHRARSIFVRGLVQNSARPAFESSVIAGKLPKRIVQFWDDSDRLPEDVGECIETWRRIEEQGFERLLFDKRQAREFICQKLGPRHKRAYDKCYHPAMQSDYFRLCYTAAYQKATLSLTDAVFWEGQSTISLLLTSDHTFFALSACQMYRKVAHAMGWYGKGR